MRKNNRKILRFVLLFTLIVFVFGSAFLYMKTREFTERLGFIIEEQASESLGYPVDIGSVTSDVFNRIVLKDFRIMDDDRENDLLNVKRVNISYSLRNILKNIKDPSKLISGINFIEPSVIVYFDDGNPFIRGLENLSLSGESEGRSIPSWKLQLSDATAKLEDTVISKADRINGEVLLGGYPEITGNLSFALGGYASKVKTDVKYHTRSRNIKSVLRGNEIELSLIEKITGNKNLKVESGTCDIDLRIKSHIDDIYKNIEKAEIHGKVKLENIKKNGFHVPFALMNITSKRLLIEEGDLYWEGNSLSFSGSIRDYISNPDMDIKVSGEVDSSTVGKWAGVNDVSGKFIVDAGISGTSDSLKASGNMKMEEGSIGEIQVSDFNTEAEFREEGLMLGSGSMNIAGGVLIWEGNWDTSGVYDMRLNAQDISISKIPWAGKTAGYIDGTVVVKGTDKKPHFSTDISLTEFKIPHRSRKSVSITGEYTDSILSIRGVTMDGGYSLDAKLEKASDKREFKVKNAELITPPAGTISIEGRCAYLPFSGDLSLKVDSVDVKEMGLIYKDFNGFEGYFDFAGDISAKEKGFFLDGKFNADSIMLNGHSYDIATEILLHSENKKMTCQLNNLNIDRGMFGDIGFSRTGEKTELSEADINIEGAAFEKMGNLFNLNSLDMQGIVTGNLTYRQGDGGGNMTVKGLSLKGEMFGDADFEVNAENGMWKFETFINKDAGSLTADGNLYPEQEINYKLKDYEVFGRIISGDGAFTGTKKEMKYKWNTMVSDVSLFNEKLPDINIAGVLEGAEEPGEKISRSLKGRVESKGSSKFNADYVIGFGEKNSVESDVEFESYRVLNILNILGYDWDMDGELSGNMKIMGTLDNPILYSEVDIKNSDVYGISSDYSGIKMEYKDKKLKIFEMAGVLTEGGRYEIGGTIGRDGIMDITAEFNSANLRNMNSIYEKAGDFEAELDFKSIITGTLSSPSVKTRLSSQGLVYKKDKFRNIEAVFKYDDNEITVENAKANYSDGRISVENGEMDLSARQFNLPFNVRNISLGRVKFMGGAQISGNIELDPITVSADVKPGSFLVNRYSLSDEFSFTYTGGEMDIKFGGGATSYVSFLPEKVTADLFINDEDRHFSGNCVFKRQGGLKAEVEGENIELSDIVRLLDVEADVSGKSSFSIYIDDDEKLNAEGSVLIEPWVYKGLEIETFSGDFTYEDGGLKMLSLRAYDPQFLEITLSGDAVSDGGFEVDIHRLSLSVLEGLFREIKSASGVFSGNYFFSYPRENIHIKGDGELTGGKIIGRGLIDSIDNITCKINAKESKIVLEKLRGDWDPGGIKGEGFIDFSKSPAGLDFKIKTRKDEGIAVKIPYLDIPQSAIFGRLLTLPSHGEPKFEIKISGDLEKHFVSGDVILNNTHFTYPPARSSKGTPSIPALRDAVIELDVRAGESVWYENTYARVKVDGGLIFKKRPNESLMVNGEVTSSQGEVTYLNRKFSVRQASLIFEDSLEYLTASAVAQYAGSSGEGWGEDQIEMRIPRTRIAEIEPEFSSSRYDEQRSSQEAAELLFAEDLGRLSQQERNILLRREFLRAIDANLTSPLIKNILRRSDLVDHADMSVRLDQDMETDNLMLSGAGLRLSRNLTDHLSMGYYMELAYGIDSPLSLNHELDMLYRLHGNRFLRATVDPYSPFRDYYIGIEMNLFAE